MFISTILIMDITRHLCNVIDMNKSRVNEIKWKKKGNEKNGDRSQREQGVLDFSL